jgi:tetraacyldisaccharide 4'-kinase
MNTIDRFVLFPYYIILKLRDCFYNCGIFKVRTCKIPTICVGNITAGGTGKTPHTEMILKTLLQSEEWGNKNIAVLSRGHKRKSKGFQQVSADGSAAIFGDEPLQIKRKYQNVTVTVDRTRVEGCDFLCNPEKLKSDKKARKCLHKDFPKSDLIVLDDAFQYRALQAAINIVLIDYYHPTYKDHLLPIGRLRDLPERLRIADIIIVTKCPTYLNVWEKGKWAKHLGIEDFNPSTGKGTNVKGKVQTLLFTSINYREMKPVYENGDSRYIYSKNLILFSGIAKDKNLRQYLSGTYRIVKHFRFSDHHKYSNFDIRTINEAIKEHSTAIVATTEKDSQRIMDNKKVPETLKERLFQVPIEVDFLTEEEQKIFETTLADSLREFRSEHARIPRE